ncbi:putative pyridoxal phosphate-dependent transferase, subdomain 2, Myb/SANT-like protein [Lupinus albus]|uniref:Putative pyridoxal phosphate-dependent transferase, subdomain 2, Myb/SANT-like protein n=1 Tax=Lupinus albus TaxID=3870 RepID=A0A6A4P0T4_LUPAL|nr:putative pyridoxal phosphate-dependent transferase, subdomain 2, Myb/SANT-like protein [Lupinus albus]
MQNYAFCVNLLALNGDAPCFRFINQSASPCRRVIHRNSNSGDHDRWMHPKAYQTRSSNVKEKYMVWTSEMDYCLIDVLAEQVKMGNKVDDILKPAAFAAALKVLNAKFGLYLTKEHIKNRLKTYRKQFRVLKEILAHRGFVWNETQQMVIADNSVWNDYIKAHPDARIFRAKSIEKFDKLCIILGNDQEIASFSENFTEIGLNLTVDKGDLDVSFVSEIQAYGNQAKSLRWTQEMDHWLGRILADQVRRGLKVDKVLQTEAYDTTVSALNAKFGLHLTKYNIKNRLKTWKKQYEQLKEILSHAGFKWDETRKMVTANDSTWNDYIQKHLDARSFRSRVFENYDQLCTIFGHFNEPLHRNESFLSDEHVEAVSACPFNYDTIVKDRGKHMRWTSEMDSCLSAVLVQQIRLGNRSKFDYKLKSAAFEAAVLAINEKFQLHLMKEHIKNRLKTWKKQYDILKELLKHSSFEWDKKRKMVMADDSVWNEYIKINPDARVLKGRIIRNFNELCIIIGHIDPPDTSLNDTMSFTIDEVLEAEETNRHGTRNAMTKVRYVTWTDEMDHCLTELLVNQVMMGNKLEKNFKTSAYIVTITALNERFGLNLTIENIKNRLKTWKKQYDLLKEMLYLGGFRWDEGRKMVVATDSEWNEYIKKHPDARHMRDRCIENFDELGLIVGNEQTSGNWFENYERPDVNLSPSYEAHAETPALMLDHEETSHDNASDEVQGSSEQTGARPSSSHSKQPSKRRRTSDVLLQMMSVMAADIGRIADSLTESNKTVCLEEVVEKVQNIDEFDDDLIIEACEYLCFDDKRACMFLKLDERLRKKWLLKRLRG